MSTKIASHFVIARKINTSSGRSRCVYLNRLLVTRITKSSEIYNARRFKTEDEARKVIEILRTRFWDKWIIQEVTKDLETLNKDGIPYSSRYKVLKELE